MVSRARLGVRHRYRDDIRLDSRYAKTGWMWCHVLVSASVVATATMSASTRVYAKTGGQWGHVLVSAPVAPPGTPSASTRVTLRQGGCGVTCSSRRPSSLPRRRPPRLALRKDRVGMVSYARLGVRRRYRDDVRLDSRYAKTGWQWCHVLVSASVVATATTSASTRLTLRQGGSCVTCSSRHPSSLPRRRPPRLALR